MHRQQITAQKIDAFCGKGQSGLYRDFAMHAAVLWVFNADLLYQMRANFRQDEQGESMPVPQEAVADLLLSSLVESLGQGWFEFDPAARELLLTEISHSPRFGKTRLDDLSDFLLQYLDRRPNAKGLENGVFAEMLHWNALMHVRPEEAAERIGLALREGSEQKNAFQPIRIQQIYEKIMLPVRHQPQFKNLELYIDGAAQLALERRGAAAKAFEQVDTAEMQFGKITLHVPKLKPIKTRFELPSGILHAAMSADGKWIAAGMYNGSVALVNLISGEITYKEVSKSDVNSVRLNDNKLLVACLDGQVYVFDWTKEEWEQLFYHKFEEAVWTAEFDSEGDRFLLGMVGGELEMRQLSKQDLINRIATNHTKDIMEAQFINSGDKCISVSIDGSFLIFDLQKNLQQTTFYRVGFWTFAVHPNQTTILIGDDKGGIELIEDDFVGEPKLLSTVKRFQAHTQSVRSIAWLPYKDQFVLLSSSTDGGILVHTTEGELLHTIQAPGGEQAMCVQIVEDKIMTATGSALNIIPVQSILAALDKGQKSEAQRQEKDTVTYSEIILYVVTNIQTSTGDTNLGLLKDLFRESLNSVKIADDIYDLNVEGMALRVRLWEVLPSELQKGLHRIYMSNGSVCLFVMNGGFDQSLIKSAQTVTDNLIVIDQNILRNIYERRTSKGFDLYEIIRENLRVKEMNQPEQLSNAQTSFSGSEQASSDMLMEILRKSPGFGVKVPKTWMDLKEVLEEKGRSIQTMPLQDFARICRSQNLEPQSLTFLHQTCSIRYFDTQTIEPFISSQPDFETKTIDPVIFLQPMYLARLNRDILRKESHGVTTGYLPTHETYFSLNLGKYIFDAHLKEMLSNNRSKSGNFVKIEPAVFQLLAYFKQCFPTDDQTGWLFPDLLPATSDVTLNVEKTAYPARVFQYEQPIQNIHYQIFAQYFSSLKPDSLSQNGAVITRVKAQVAIIIDKTARSISLLIDGSGSGALRQEIEAKLDVQNKTENFKAIKSVPCICSQCLQNKEATLFKLAELIYMQKEGIEIIFCNRSSQNISIETLLSDEPDFIQIETLTDTLLKISNVNESRILQLLEGKDYFSRRTWLQKGLQAYLAVCKVTTTTSQNSAGFATGFLLEDETILTCEHNLLNANDAKTLSVEFSLFDQSNQKFIYSLDAENFDTSHKLDLNYSKVDVINRPDIPLSSWGFISIQNEIKVKPEEPVFLIRYHDGHLKQIDLKPSVVLELEKDYLYYTYHEKSAGSSGGPIFNANWECIGMHLAAYEGEGNRIKDGRKSNKSERKGLLLNKVNYLNYDYFKRIVENFEKNPESKVNNPERYIRNVANLVTYSILDKQPVDSRFMPILEQIPPTDPDFLNLTVYLNLINFLSQKDFVTAEKFLEQHNVIEQLKSSGHKINTSRKQLISYYAGVIYFLCGKYSDAGDYFKINLNPTQNGISNNASIEASALYNLLCLIEDGTAKRHKNRKALLDSIVKKLEYRLLNNTKQGFIHQLFDLLPKLLDLSPSGSEMVVLAQNSIDSLKTAFFTERTQVSHLGLFVAWLECKAKKRDIMELIGEYI